MPISTRAQVADVIARIRGSVAADVKCAAGNTLLSSAEAQGSGSSLIAGAHEDVVRKKGFWNVRVGTTEATDAAMAIVEKNIAAINQATGSGHRFLSQDEIKRLQGVDVETARHAAKAYELITGKRVALDGRLPQDRSELPAGAQQAVVDDLVDYFWHPRAAPVNVKDVRSVDGGYAFKIQSNVYTGDAFVREAGGRFVVAAEPFSQADYNKVLDAARRWFDSDFAPEMRDEGASEAKIADVRAKLLPARAFLPGETSDPYGYTSTYPFVFQLDNASGDNQGIYAGYDPATGKVDVYAFD